jgi:hypothetical protein
MEDTIQQTANCTMALTEAYKDCTRVIKPVMFEVVKVKSYIEAKYLSKK